MKRYSPNALKPRIHTIEMYMDCRDIDYVCRKYHIREKLQIYVKYILNL